MELTYLFYKNYSGRAIAISAFVYSSLTSVKIEINDGVSTQTSTETITASAWNQITYSVTLSAGATTLKVRFLATGADSLYVDGACGVGGSLALGYIESDIEMQTKEHATENYENMIFNADNSYAFPLDAAPTRYAPLGWQEKTGSEPSTATLSTAEANGGLYAWDLKLEQLDEVFNETIAPVAYIAKRYQGVKLSFGIEVKRKGALADDLTIYIADNVDKDVKTFALPTAYTWKWVTRTIDAAATSVTVGMKNLTIGAGSVNFYVSRFIVKLGSITTIWVPSTRFDRVTYVGGFKGAITGTEYLSYGDTPADATHCPEAEGIVIAIAHSIAYAVAPGTAGTDDWKIAAFDRYNSISYGAKATFSVAVGDIRGRGGATFIPNTSHVYPQIDAARYGVQLAQESTGIATVAGTKPVGTMDIWVLR
jgi:hypothetical protein